LQQQTFMNMLIKMV